MPVFSGTISGSIKSVPFNVPANIKSFSVWNRTAGSVTVNIGFVISGTDVYIKNIVLAAGVSSSVDLTEIRMLAGTKILIVASGSVDYFFTIDDIDDVITVDVPTNG